MVFLVGYHRSRKNSKDNAVSHTTGDGAKGGGRAQVPKTALLFDNEGDIEAAMTDISSCSSSSKSASGEKKPRGRSTLNIFGVSSASNSPTRSRRSSPPKRQQQVSPKR